MEENPDRTEPRTRPAVNDDLLRRPKEEELSRQKEELLRKQKIANQVDTEIKRRRWLLRFYAALLLVGLLLGGVALRFAEPATQIMALTDDQLIPIREKIYVMVSDSAKEANKQVTVIVERANKSVTEASNKAIEDVDNTRETAHAQIIRDTNQANAAITKTTAEANKSVTVTAQAASNNISELAEKEVRNRILPSLTRLDRLEASQDRFGLQLRLLNLDPTGKPRIFSEYETRLTTTTQTVGQLKETIEDLKTQLIALKQQVNSLKSQTTVAVPQRSSYPVKEDSKAQIYDLDINLELGTQKNGVVSRIKISSTQNRLINGKTSFEVKDLAMGKPVTFNDGVYTYTLRPIYIQRRRLMNDFIGVAIERALIVITPTTPAALPTPTPTPGTSQ